MRLHRPLSLLHLGDEVGSSLARLSGLEGLTRSLMVGSVPLTVLDVLGSKKATSIAFSVGAVLTLLVTLNLGSLEKLIARRGVATVGISCLFAAAILFAARWSSMMIGAVALRSAASSIFSVMLTLYIMDYVGKADLIRNESNRLAYNGAAWLVGPSLGIWLWTKVDPAAPYVLSAFLSVGLMIYYWALRLGPNKLVVEPKSHPTSPLRTIPRYFGQKNLRIAYLITFVRATFWVALFVYSPLYVVEAGLPTWVAGALLSGISGLLLFSHLIRRIADGVGTRAVAVGGFMVVGASMTLLAMLGEPRGIGLVCWVVAAIGAWWLDVVGNIPFMRLVKPRERVPMTTVFSTWREMSQFVGPGIAAVVLAAGAPFSVFYAVIAVMAFATAATATYLPRRL